VQVPYQTHKYTLWAFVSKINHGTKFKILHFNCANIVSASEDRKAAMNVNAYHDREVQSDATLMRFDGNPSISVY
jgi:hypothetical protein